ncbi:MAG: XdhC family protein, partial [Dehalococcoidia bacterium]
MFDDLLEQVIDLKKLSKPFVLATVVACKPPTSAKPGAKAIVQPDGSFHGWVGGSCAQPLVIQESLKALQDGQTRLVLLAPNPEEVDIGLEGIVLIPMTCQSEGTLAIYLEPFLPKPQLMVIG